MIKTATRVRADRPPGGRFFVCSCHVGAAGWVETEGAAVGGAITSPGGPTHRDSVATPLRAPKEANQRDRNRKKTSAGVEGGRWQSGRDQPQGGSSIKSVHSSHRSSASFRSCPNGLQCGPMIFPFALVSTSFCTFLRQSFDC